MDQVSKNLIRYIEDNVFPGYSQNDPGHGLEHIQYVIRRSLKFAKTVPGINFDMVYCIAAYHDIAHYIDHEHHEELSSKQVREDPALKQFFSAQEIEIMADAVFDHRSSLEDEPRSIYGKIVSSADGNTSVRAALMRSYAYRVAHGPELTTEEKIEESRKHLLEKFGPKGYAVNKIYFPDPEYEKFLADVTALAADPEEFTLRSIAVNHIKELEETCPKNKQS